MAEITVTTNFEFLEDLPEHTEVVAMEGSTRSSKTFSIFQWLILWCLEDPGVRIRCFRNDEATHNKTTIPDFKEVMQSEQLDVWDQGRWNVTEKIFRFNNGSYFAFAGTNDPAKLHGMKQDVAWYNEVMEIAIDARTQVEYRTTTLEIMDWNPSFNHHWVFDQVLSQPTTAYKHSTYKDNPFLTSKQISGIEKYNPEIPENIQRGTANQYKWDVYGLGKRGKIEGAIFSLWEITDFWPEKHMCSYWGYGQDFGSVDPNALVECAIYNNQLYLRERMYESDLLATPNVSRPELPSLESRYIELGISKDAQIVADCARPEIIKDLQTSGYNMVKCVKGPGSILAGIDLMKSYKIHIHRSSHNLQLEFEQYAWKKRADGVTLEEPIDEFNHAVDAARYWCMRNIPQIISETKRARTGRQQCTKAKNGLRNFR